MAGVLQFTGISMAVFHVVGLTVLLNVTDSELNKNPVEGFSAGLIDDDDIYQWEVVVIGPQDTLL